MQRGGDKLFRKMGLQTPYFDSGGGQEGRLAIRGLRALEPPASKMGSVTMTGPLSRALRQRNIVNDDFVCIVTMTPPNLPAHFITQREIAEAAPVEYLQKHGF